MFGSLFVKECKQMLKCLTYYIVVICLVLFYSTQLGSLGMIKKPIPGQEDYGMKYSKAETDVMNETVKVLVREYKSNNYYTYPIGFSKIVNLNKKENAKMSEIVAEVTGMTVEELEDEMKNYISGYLIITSKQIDMALAPNLTFDRFKELMKKADQLLGGGSSYSKSYLYSNARVPMTYEDAVEEYNEIIQKDKLTGAYARYFCDYLGILLAILPVFIAVTRSLRDRRARAGEVIYAKMGSSVHIVMSRYLAMLFMLLLPVILLGTVSMLDCFYLGSSEGIAIDYFAYANYIMGWLLPAIMISTSVGIFLTELTDTAIAIIVQGLWWFISIFMGIVNIRGGYGWNLIPRHNELGNYAVFHDNFDLLVQNRITYSLIAILLAFLTVAVYDKKRRGKFRSHGKIFSNRNNKSEI